LQLDALNDLISYIGYFLWFTGILRGACRGDRKQLLYKSIRVVCKILVFCCCCCCCYCCFSRLKIAGYSVTTSWFHAHASLPRDGAVYTRKYNVYRGMARVQTNEMKATPAIYVPEINEYNSHLIGCYPRHSRLNA